MTSKKYYSLAELQNNYRVIDLFVKLCKIPSPSTKEEKLSQEIMRIFNENNIEASFDGYKNIIARIRASKGYKKTPPILLSAHMDVVGGSEEVNVRLSADGEYIETDKTRTLGADNKAGAAAILDLAISLSKKDSQIPHGEIEIIFTRDEELKMSGIKNLDASLLNSKYAIICDGEKLGELDTEGAGFTCVFIKAINGKGGHSGINIADKTRINAVKVISEIAAQIPQGAFKEDGRGTVTSINAGAIFGGSVNTCFSENIKEAYLAGKLNQPSDELFEKFAAKNVYNFITNNAALNIISTEASVAYSVRSSEPENENELLKIISGVVNSTKQKYEGLIDIQLEIKTHLKPFVKSNDSFLADVMVKAGAKQGLRITPGNFHAGAETHILSNEKKNSAGESFIPVLAGLADLENIHSSDEKIGWKSFLQGRQWLEDIIIDFCYNTGG